MTAQNVGTGASEQGTEPGAGPIATGELGVVVGLLSAIPLIGPALVAGCLGCLGVGAAAELGSATALPPTWWLAGLGAAAGVSALFEHRRARRCHRTPAPLRAVTILVVVAAGAWLVNRFGVLPALDWTTGGGGASPTGPRLP